MPAYQWNVERGCRPDQCITRRAQLPYEPLVFGLMALDRLLMLAAVDILIRAVGPLVVVIGLFWFAHGTGLFTCPYNAATVNYGAALVAAGFVIVWLGWQ
jgi:hypothetical protein